MGEKDSKSGGDKKATEEVKKADDGAAVVLKIDMHCEGCAKKIRNSVKRLQGVESVKADWAANKLTVMGKVDPSKVLERLESKTKKKAVLLSPQPPKKDDKPAAPAAGGGDKKSAGEEKKPEEKAEKKPDEKKKEVTTVVLKIDLHCDGCMQKIRKIIRKYKGVENVTVDAQKDLVTVEGTMDMKALLPYLKEKLKRSVDIVAPKKDEGGDKKGGDEKKDKDGGGEKKKEGGDGEKKDKEGGGEKKNEGGEKKDKDGGEKKKEGGGGDKKEGDGKSSGGGDGGKREEPIKVAVNKMEYYPYPAGYGYGYENQYKYENGYAYESSNGYGGGYGAEYENGQEYVVQYPYNPHVHAPQLFSDENPNACSIM